MKQDIKMDEKTPKEIKGGETERKSHRKKERTVKTDNI
jgi:hypothetical protein